MLELVKEQYEQGVFSTGFLQTHLKKDCPIGSLFQGLLFKSGAEPALLQQRSVAECHTKLFLSKNFN